MFIPLNQRNILEMEGVEAAVGEAVEVTGVVDLYCLLLKCQVAQQETTREVH